MAARECEEAIERGFLSRSDAQVVYGAPPGPSLFERLDGAWRVWAHRRRWLVLGRTRLGYDVVWNWSQVGADVLAVAVIVAVLVVGAWVASHGGTDR
jgi:hypothetical protein